MRLHRVALAVLAAALVVPAPASATYPGKPGLIAYRGGSITGPEGGIYTVMPDGTGNELAVPDARDPSWSANGRRLAFVLEEDELWESRADGSDRRRIVGDDELPDEVTSVHGPTWSPDGRRLAFVVSGERMDGPTAPDTFSEVWVVRRNGTGMRKLATGYYAAWSPNGRRIAYLYGGDKVVWEKPNGRGRRVLRRAGSNSSLYGLDFSPSGRYLVYQNTPSDPLRGKQRLHVLDVKTRKVKRLRSLASDRTQIASFRWRPSGGRIGFVFRTVQADDEFRTFTRRGRRMWTLFSFPPGALVDEFSWQAR